MPSTVGKEFSDLPPVEKTIRFYEELIKQNPKDAMSYVALAQACMRRARESGDVSSYQRAESSLTEALHLSPGSLPARTSLAMVYYSEHRFTEALTLSRELSGKDPNNSDVLAIWGDVNLALGNYAEAEGAYKKLEKKTLNSAVLARMAQLTEVKGRPDEAITLMYRAVQDAVQNEVSGEALAWYVFRLGELNFNRGNVSEAEGMYEAALQVFPRYYQAFAGIGKVKSAQGKYQEAISYYQKATAIIPQPDFVASLGDLYFTTGEKSKAQIQYETVEYIGKLAEINRQIYNRQLANFYSDHAIHTDRALQLALAELKFRKDVFGYDAAAWAYLKNGNAAEAKKMIDQAMRLNTQDARLFYHAGMVAKERGDLAEAKRLLARAIRINPHFDLLQTKIARDTLDHLKSGPIRN